LHFKKRSSPNTFVLIPSAGKDYFGQDAIYLGNTPSYTDNGDGTLTDKIIGLMRQSILDHDSDNDTGESLIDVQ
jgi:hypothetical protein